METAWFVGAFSAIFFVIDPLAVVPIFLAMTPDDDDTRRAVMARRATFVAAAVLFAFALGGQALFQLFGVTLPAFKVAGGVLLLLTALDQLRSHESNTRTSGVEVAEGRAKEDVAIVPLAMPLLAGPGSIATVMVLAGEAKTLAQTFGILASIAVTCAVAFALLRVSNSVNTLLGATGRAVFLRVSGLLLAAVAVQFILSGIGDAFPALSR